MTTGTAMIPARVPSLRPTRAVRAKPAMGSTSSSVTSVSMGMAGYSLIWVYSSTSGVRRLR